MQYIYIYIFFFLSFTYSCVSWRPIVMFLMEIELYELEFHASFFNYFFKFDRPILNFLQIEFYIETRFWENRVTKEGHFPNYFGKGGRTLIFLHEKCICPFSPEKVCSHWLLSIGSMVGKNNAKINQGPLQLKQQF